MNLSDMARERTQQSPSTLGDVLYAKSKAPVLEQEWVTLVQSIAAGDQLALHALYERAHGPVFTLIMQITANRETAEELTVDVFHNVWRRASRYDAANGTVLGWIMNQARSRAIDRLRFENRKKRSHGGDEQPKAEEKCRSMRSARAARAGPVTARGIGDAHAGRAPGDRNHVLRRAYACRSRGASQ